MFDIESQNEGMRHTCFIVILIVILCGLWYLFSRPESGGGNYNNIEVGLDSIAREQQTAKDSIGRIQQGIERSEESVERLADSVERSGELVGSISNDIERSAGEVDIAMERVRSAGERNREVEEGISRAEERVSDGLRINSASESIFARYSGGNQGK